MPAASLLLSPELMPEQRPEPDSPNNLTGGGVGVSNQTDVIELLTVDILSCMGSYAHGGYVSMCPYSPVELSLAFFIAPDQTHEPGSSICVRPK